ncbi:helix-turn-helix domain-containing protein [Plantactinospora sp. CA-290183]|uniref:helix-turn-helix domain-containing protein n=1 Tax=Plantactinospora sp. CA-290183 TaxID=3240006 RepID=UPI003D93F63E
MPSNAAGCRYDAARGSGSDGWAAAELRVARLVAQGLTNRAVAGRLAISPHTVDTHLRHVFGKLDVRGRVELTRHVMSYDGSQLTG